MGWRCRGLKGILNKIVNKMGVQSKIQWTDATWNVARGCTKVDADCKYCYMYRDSMNGKRHDPYKVERTKGVFTMPLRLKVPSRIFTSSLTDFFHPDIDSYRAEAWDIIRRCPQHTFQILTKRPERIADHLPADWGEGWDNVWLGTSVGSGAAVQRIRDLVRGVHAKVKFLSLEPLHGPVNLRHVTCKVGIGEWEEEFYALSGIDWVIVGGESGWDKGKYRYRPCEVDWLKDIVAKCKREGVPVFVKQLGTHLSKLYGLKDRNGGDMDEWPEELDALKVREWPVVR
jgi:protein gp37